MSTERSSSVEINNVKDTARREHSVRSSVLQSDQIRLSNKIAKQRGSLDCARDKSRVAPESARPCAPEPPNLFPECTHNHSETESTDLEQEQSPSRLFRGSGYDRSDSFPPGLDNSLASIPLLSPSAPPASSRHHYRTATREEQAPYPAYYSGPPSVPTPLRGMPYIAYDSDMQSVAASPLRQAPYFLSSEYSQQSGQRTAFAHLRRADTFIDGNLEHSPSRVKDPEMPSNAFRNMPTDSNPSNIQYVIPPYPLATLPQPQPATSEHHFQHVAPRHAIMPYPPVQTLDLALVGSPIPPPEGLKLTSYPIYRPTTIFRPPPLSLEEDITDAEPAPTMGRLSPNRHHEVTVVGPVHSPTLGFNAPTSDVDLSIIRSSELPDVVESQLQEPNIGSFNKGSERGSTLRKLFLRLFSSREPYAPTARSPLVMTRTSKFSLEILSTRTLLMQIYLHFLFRLPSMYFSRVGRIFEEANLSLPELKKMALQTGAEELALYDHLAPIPAQYIMLRKTWESFIDSSMREWKTFNIISAVLVSAILTVLQLQSADQDPIIRYTALSSLICALISLLFGCMYIVRFGSMRRTYKAAEWALEARQTTRFIWWNVWVLLAMPAVWLVWSIVLYIACIMSFVWRTGSQGAVPPLLISDTTLLAIRVMISTVLGLGVLYAILTLNTLSRYGESMDKAWHSRIIKWVYDIKDDSSQRGSVPDFHPSPLVHPYQSIHPIIPPGSPMYTANPALVHHGLVSSPSPTPGSTRSQGHEHGDSPEQKTLCPDSDSRVPSAFEYPPLSTHEESGNVSQARMEGSRHSSSPEKPSRSRKERRVSVSSLTPLPSATPGTTSKSTLEYATTRADIIPTLSIGEPSPRCHGDYQNSAARQDSEQIVSSWQNCCDFHIQSSQTVVPSEQPARGISHVESQKSVASKVLGCPGVPSEGTTTSLIMQSHERPPIR